MMRMMMIMMMMMIMNDKYNSLQIQICKARLSVALTKYQNARWNRCDFRRLFFKSDKSLITTFNATSYHLVMKGHY